MDALAAYPTRAARAQIAAADWDAAVHAWTSWLRDSAAAPDSAFEELFGTEQPLSAFIYAYLDAHTPRKNADEHGFTGATATKAEDELSEAVFLVLERVFHLESTKLQILKHPFVLFDFCVLYALDCAPRVLHTVEHISLSAERQVIIEAHRVRDEYIVQIQQLVETEKIIQEKKQRVQLQALMVFVRLCAPATCVFLDEGFIGLIARVYQRGALISGIKEELLWLVFTLFTSFLWERGVCEQIVRRFRWLYEEEWVSRELLRDLVLETEIVERFYEGALFSEEIVSELRALREASLPGKLLPGKQLPGIQKLQELFPASTEAFLDECLCACGGDVEAAVCMILESNSTVDTQKSIDTCTGKERVCPVNSGCPVATGNDRCLPGGNKLDRVVEIQKIYRGKKGYASADAMLEDKLFVREHKQMIMDSVFVNDEDEKDDTYEEAGSSDGEVREECRMNRVDGILYTTYIVSPEVFNRTMEARRSCGRKELQASTGLSDEQIECWKMMLDRNPRQAEKYEEMYGFSGNEALPSSKWSSDQNRGFDKDFSKTRFLNTRGKKNRKNR